MGTAFAPNYANIYMGYFEQKALSKAPNNLQPLIWKRFTDPIFFIWTHGGTALQGFYDYLNTIHPTIKFEISHSNQEINFLDTTIFFEHGTKLESTLFVKSTDTCSLLHATSFHPDSCKSSVIYSQALRYCRIITDHTKLKEQVDIPGTESMGKPWKKHGENSMDSLENHGAWSRSMEPEQNSMVFMGKFPCFPCWHGTGKL